MFNIIFASDSMDGIGKNNNIPWNMPQDIELFKSLTTSIGGLQKVVIMGYKTMMSLKSGYLKKSSTAHKTSWSIKRIKKST